jgi:hypothetical protein
VIILGPLWAIAALWLTGALALSLMGARRDAGIDVLVMDFATGVVILAAIGMALLALGGRLSLAPFYLLLILLSTAAAWRRRPIRLRLRIPQSGRARALLVGVGVLLVMLAISASQDRLVWDGWAFWTLKARILFLEGAFPPTVLDPAGPYPYAHPDYPLAVPLLDWWLYRHAGTARPALASLAGALWFVTLPALVWAALHRRLGEDGAALATLGTAAFWPLAFYATGGYADIVIALALLGGVLELERARHDGAMAGAAVRLTIFLTLAALAKNEGLALAALGAGVALTSWLRYGERRPLPYVALMLPFLASAPWLLKTRRLGLVPQHLAGASPTLGDALARIPTVLSALGELILSRAWIPLPFIVLAGLSAVLRHRRLASSGGWALISGYGIAIGTVYLTTALELEWLLRTTLDRMVGDIVPAIVVLALLEIWRERNEGAGPGEGTGGPAQDSMARRMTSASSVGLE